jgi:hypothetical protein
MNNKTKLCPYCRAKDIPEFDIMCKFCMAQGKQDEKEVSNIMEDMDNIDWDDCQEEDD